MLDATEIARARQVDLLRLIEPDTQLTRIANTRGGEYAGPCPFCGGVDRFHIAPALGRWYCRQCAPRGGDAIDYVRRRHRASFTEAVALLTGQHWQAQRTARPPVTRSPTAVTWPLAVWQREAERLIAEGQHRLADASAGAAGRRYLATRGIAPPTWQAWQLGFSFAWQPIQKGLHPAITLPWYAADGRIQALQYRFFAPPGAAEVAKRDRFGQKAGGLRVLCGLPLRAGRSKLIVVEGELNAVSLWQVAQARADVLSCGSQEGILQPETRKLLATLVGEYAQVFIWLDALPKAAQATPLIAPANGYTLWSEGGLDANDRLRDGSLVGWLADHGV